MTLSKVVRKGSYQGVAQWGINTSSEITPSRATARKWAELENARNPMNHVANGLSPEHGRLTRTELFAAIQSLNWLYGRGELIEREMRVFADGRTECTSRLQYGTSKFTARFNGRTVYARGHQTTVKRSQQS